MLKPPEHARTKERILAFGSYGSGKSHGWASIRDLYATTDTPGHFHIISTEWEMADRTAEGYANFNDNATIHEATDFESLLGISEKISEAATGDDWLVIDSVGSGWSWAQDDYCQGRWGKTFKEYQADLGNSNSDINWQFVNNAYRSWINPHVIRFPGHKYACAQADVVASEGKWKDGPEIQGMYGRFGVKPVGQKELGYAFHSVLLFKHPTRTDWQITTIDDPSRVHVDSHPVATPPLGFVDSYLVKIAGWRFE